MYTNTVSFSVIKYSIGSSVCIHCINGMLNSCAVPACALFSLNVEDNG